MPGKLRVHELAKKLGVTSKELLATLKEQGEFVKTASSTVEPPVVRKMEAFYEKKDGAGGSDSAAKPSAGAGAGAKPGPKPGPAPKPAPKPAAAKPAAPAPKQAAETPQNPDTPKP
ncbi:MAG: translation initiation factor IF-2 N-terminal domain-containing protein, partial [Corynebacterium sp.]|uniref:translation initiation factor IF-2 N-terminal domain-containing protein n=1 Tax=Corynebacterium sp. TaxID=1720 RepID=UPI0026E03370